MIFARIDNISDHQIFQQQHGSADITVVGHMVGIEEAETGHYVFASLLREYNGTHVLSRVQGVWEEDRLRYRLTLEQVPAGGLYTLQVFYTEPGNWDGAINGDVRFRIGVGDIWLIAGQSNAVGYGKTPSWDHSEGRVNLMDNSGAWREAVNPIGAGCGADNETGEGFVVGISPFISFANTLARELNYPIGLIMTAWGGTSVKLWVQEGPLYRRMLDMAARAGGKIRGIAWYQGCTDADCREDAERYLSRFQSFVSGVRVELEDETIPFLTVQINKGFGDYSGEHMENWAMVKEAQRLAAMAEGIYVMSSSDLPLSDFVHNNGVACSVLGQRMAWQALEQVYHKAYFGMPPMLEKVTVDGRQVTAFFKNVHLFLVDNGAPVELRDFLFEDAAGEVRAQSCMIRENRCVFRLEREPQGELLCSFAPFCVNHGAMIFDRATGIPPVSFYHVAAQKESCTGN